MKIFDSVLYNIYKEIKDEMWKHLKIIYENDITKKKLRYNYSFDNNSNISKLISIN